MEAYPYEHPLKSGARRLVRELFVFWLIGSIGFLVFMYAMSSRSEFTLLNPAYLIFGLPAGVALWLLYRLGRFAIG